MTTVGQISDVQIRYASNVAAAAAAADAKAVTDLGVAVSETDTRVKRAEKSAKSLANTWVAEDRLTAKLAAAKRGFAFALADVEARVKSGEMAEEKAAEARVNIASKEAAAEAKVTAAHKRWLADASSNDNAYRNMATAVSEVAAANDVLRAAILAATASGSAGYDELVGSAQRYATVMSGIIANASFGVKTSPSVVVDDSYIAFWNGAASEIQAKAVELARQSQVAVNNALGVQYWGPVGNDARAEYEAFWNGIVARQDAAATEAAGNSQRAVNALLGVQYWGPLSREVRGEYEALWATLLDGSEEKAATENAKLAASYQQIALAINPMAAAQQKYESSLAGLRAGAQAAGKSAVELAADERLLEQQYLRTVSAIKSNQALSETASTAGLSKNSMMMLNASVINTFQSLGSGMNVSMVAMQQLPQVIGAFAQESEGLTNFTTGLVSAVKAAPLLAGAVAGVAVAVGAGAAAFLLYNASIREVDQASRLMGGSLGRTTDDLIDLAARSAEAGNVSANSARTMIAEYNKLGAIGPATIQGLIGITRDFAAATGQDTDEASKSLGAMFSDPAKGAVDLADKYNLLSAAEIQRVRELDAAGKKTEAQAILVQKLGDRIKGAAENTGWWSRQWDSLGKHISDTLGAIGSALSDPTLSDRINALSEAKASKNTAAFSRLGGDAALQKLLTQSRWERMGAYSEEDADRQSRELQTLADKYAPAITQAGLMRAEEERLTKAIADGKDATGQYAAALVGLKRSLQDLADPSAAFVRDMREQAAVTIAGIKSARDAEIETATQAALIKVGKEPLTAGPTMARANATEGVSIKYDAEHQKTVDQLGKQLTATKELAAAEASLDPVRKINAQREVDYQDAVNRGFTAIQAATQADGKRAVAMAQLGGQAGAASAQLSLQARASMATGAAWETATGGVSAYVDAQTRAILADAQAAAAADHLTSARDHLREIAAGTYAASAKTVADLQNEVDWEERIAAATANGVAARAEAIRQQEVYAATTRMIATAKALESAGMADDAKKFRELAGEYDTLSKKRQLVGFTGFLNSQIDQLKFDAEDLKRQRGLIGADDFTRARSDAEASVTSWLRQQGKEYEGLSASEKTLVDEVRKRTVANAETNVQIAHQKQLLEDVAGVVVNFSDSIGDAFAEMASGSKSAADAMRDAVSDSLADIEKMMWKLAVTNPLKNALTGGSEATLSSVGGLLGNALSGLFGSSKSSSSGAVGAPIDLTGTGTEFFATVHHSGGVVGVTPAPVRAADAALWDDANRYHTGGVAGMAPGEVPAILMRGETVLTEAQMSALRSPTVAAPIISIPSPPANTNGPVVKVGISVTNNVASDTEVKQGRMTTGADGSIMLEMIVDRIAGKKAAQPGSALRRGMRAGNEGLIPR